MSNSFITRDCTKGQRPDGITAWAEGPGAPTPKPSRAEGPAQTSVPRVPLVEFHPILRQHRPHLVLKTPLRMVHLLVIDIPTQRLHIRRTNGKQPIPTLPPETCNPLHFHPGRRGSLQPRHNIRRSLRRGQTQPNMYMVRNTTHAKTFAPQLPRQTRQISVQTRPDLIMNQRLTPFRAKHDVNQIQAQCLRHQQSHASGLQPSRFVRLAYLGLRPGLSCRRALGPLFSGTPHIRIDAGSTTCYTS